MAKRKKKQRTKKRPQTRRQTLHREKLSVTREAKQIVESAQRAEAKVVTLGNLVFFSTAEGDAWVLDPEDHLAQRLAELGEPLPYQIVETPTTFGVGWNAQYALSDAGFMVLDGDGKVTMFPSYPVEHIRDGERRTNQSI